MSQKKLKLGRKWSRRDIILFLERLELYVSAGLTAHKAVGVIAEEQNAKNKNSLFHLKERLSAGTVLAKALEENIGLPKVIVGLIESGEAVGDLVGALGRAKKLLEKEDDLKKKFTGAMIYPMAIAVFAVVLVFGLMKGVMPQITSILKGLNTPLPILTRIVMAIAVWTASYGWITIIALFAITFLFFWLKKSKPGFWAFIQGLFCGLPLFGGLFATYHVSVFIYSLGSLIDAGMGVPEAFAKAVSTSALAIFGKNSSRDLAELQKGLALSAILAKIKIMPTFVTALSKAGEATGTLGSSLLRAAAILDRDLEYKLKKLTALVEPAMMAGLGSVVGAIALSIMLPIYDISKILQK